SVFQKTQADGSKLRVHFYYNRTFCPTGRKKELLACGSYTHIFRPDYPLVIFPDEYALADRDPLKSEALAENKGHIAYLHFDAKFRVELLNQLFGKEYKSVSEEESEIPADIQQQLDAEHQETSIADIYKRGDLYKMHTYNDAIRRMVVDAALS
ncbi:MAG: hypothetical protein HW382_1227, partial [Deltaproteobacteria bacterium]|nr:hypothetical protein [Deltaproteobacteria bacterium]